MDVSLETHQSYIGQPLSALPTPALVISKPVLENNVKKLHEDVETLGIGFRPHVKTLKVRCCSISKEKSYFIFCGYPLIRGPEYRNYTNHARQWAI